MAKIDFIKVEQNLHQAMHMIFVKKLVQGRQNVYSRAIAFYGHNIAKPSPPDSVIEAINEWRIEQEGIEKQPVEGTVSDVKVASTKVEQPAGPTAELERVPSDEQVYISPVFILKKHLLWFIRKRVANIYKLLGTTKEEVLALRKKKELTAEELKRVQEILVKAQEVNKRLMKKLGIDTDDALVEQEKKKHRTKRFNIRETWLPL